MKAVTELALQMSGKAWRAWGLAWLLLGTALLASAQTDPGSAERLMRKSGLWAQLEGVGQQVREGLLQGAAQTSAQTGRSLEPAELERLQAAAAAAYTAERLRAAALRTISQELDSQHLRALNTWYDGATGVLITRQEETFAARPGDPGQQVADGAARLAAMPEARRAQVEAVVAASGSVDAALSAMLNTIAGVRQGLANALPPGAGPTPEVTRALLAQQIQQLKPAYEQMLPALSALVYADTSDSQLADYVAFLRSPAGQHLSAVMQKALDAAFLEGGAEFGRRLAAAGGPSA
jgi:hypothetical protein